MWGLLKPLSQHFHGMPMEKCKGMGKEAKYIWKMGKLNKQALFVLLRVCWQIRLMVLTDSVLTLERLMLSLNLIVQCYT